MTRPNITAKELNSKPSDSDIWLYETIIWGHGSLAARITPSGERLFYFVYMNSQKKREVHALGTYDRDGANGLLTLTEARAKATAITIDPKNITPEQLAQFNQAQSGLSSSLSRLLVSVEQYPQLRANENFLKLQDELASTENQILTARTRFNESVQKYNNYILVFPNSIFLGNYKEKPYFDAVAATTWIVT